MVAFASLERFAVANSEATWNLGRSNGMYKGDLGAACIEKRDIHCFPFIPSASAGAYKGM